MLRGVVGDRALVFAKVNLADLFFVATGDHRRNRALANRVDRKHVDFLVCDSKSVRPIVALELDDQSHSRADRKARDELVAGVFAAAGLPLVRVLVKSGYTLQEIQAMLNPFLQPAAVVKPLATAATPVISTPAPVVNPATPPPACPKCGAVMLLRTAKTGANVGGKFWAAQLPRCRTVLAVTV